MVMSRQHERWRDDVDVARVSAQPRCIAAAWILAAALIVLGAIGPATAALIETAVAALR
jgi:hypothetical protein